VPAAAQPTQSNAVPNSLEAYLPFRIPSHGLAVRQNGSRIQLALELVYEAPVGPLAKICGMTRGLFLRQPGRRGQGYLCAPVWLRQRLASPLRHGNGSAYVTSSSSSPGLEWWMPALERCAMRAPCLAPPSNWYAIHSSVRNLENTSEILAVALNITAGAEAVRLSAEPFKIADQNH
jgi:hypothetical protein